MKTWSLRIGKLFGIDVFIHWSFWLLIIWILYLQISGGGGIFEAVWATGFIFALFACVVFHELGHALTAKRFGIGTKDITLYPIGGVASLEKMPDEPWRELLVAIAGPAVNLAIAALLLVYFAAAGTFPDPSALESAENLSDVPFLFTLFTANLIVAVFNLIPAFPMDGGRALRALLSLMMAKPAATRIAAAVGQILAVVFVLLGFYYNPWLIIIGLFVFLGAGVESAGERTKTALSGLTVEHALMRRFTSLSPFDTLGTAVEALLNSQETDFVVLDMDEPIGLLTRSEIIKGLTEKGPEARVSSFMNREFFVVGPELNLSDFLQEVASHKSDVALVMKDGELLGMIDRENVEEKLLVERALRGNDQ
ncbi:MAG: site-2 protease family protein [Acidobacteria bacterium]|nr:MAG: site-2 protease family protein [Acidobacteriota bacterium]REJ98196.1 MAG: site-2 protease family protein [Acidobacteriota bacterium]REK16940.1 MAG: site-2 protease family protein [Acidobacteriota bacterium]REK42850.1 MAG: site-2 protease family protein [Acidobacteriota bacterium]